MAAAIGLFTTPAAMTAAILSVYVLGIPNFILRVSHEWHHFVWFAFLLACCDSGASWSVDAWRRRRKGVVAPGVVSGFPIRVAWLLYGLIYVIPGLWKLLSPDGGWLHGDTLRLYVYTGWFETWGRMPPVHLDLSPAAWRIGGILAITYEISFIFLILFRATRPFAVIAGVLFHLVIWFSMGIDFRPLLVLYVVFADWSVLIPARSGGPLQPATLPAGRMEIAAGSSLLLGALLCGILAIDSWPLSTYPRFQLRPPLTFSSLSIEAEDASGQVRRIHPVHFMNRLRPGRWRTLQRNVISRHWGVEQQRVLEQLTALLREDGLDLASLRAVRYYGEVRAVNALSMDGPVLRRELVGEVPGRR